jgi:protein-tyrosine kinase
MSLVEKALRKLQANRPAPPPPSQSPPETVRSTRVAENRAVGAQPPPPTAVVVPLQDFDPRSVSKKVVTIDKDYLRSVDMLPPVSQEREIATQFRAIKRPLIQHVLESGDVNDRTRHTIMVASALPGDGKTFTSLNLALSLAREVDVTVLLIDADAPKPHLTHSLKLEKEPGLLDLLADEERRVEDVILATDLPRLHVMPVGTRSETATELLASARMAEIVARLGSLYRRGIVVFDSPPILPTTEARSLAANLGQIVLVVRAGSTPQQAVKDAVGALGEGRRISLVLNGAKLDGPVGYYYGYQYGYGEQAEEAPPPAAANSE